VGWGGGTLLKIAPRVARRLDLPAYVIAFTQARPFLPEPMDAAAQLARLGRAFGWVTRPVMGLALRVATLHPPW
jgi:hypothetical protein